MHAWTINGSKLTFYESEFTVYEQIAMLFKSIGRLLLLIREY